MSSSVFLHIGQCGNQVGEVFWRRAIEEYRTDEATPGACPLFHEDGKASCVLIDSESKVINSVRSNLGSAIRGQNVCLDSNGRANNWAMGFRSSARELEAGKGLFHSAVESVRQEMERLDSVSSVVLLHSLAGGTGSGVGSAMLQYLRDACPALTIVTCSVGPFSSGECPTQWYNAAFSAHYLTELADVVIYRDNDANISQCIRTATGGPPSAPAAQKQQFTMSSINNSLAADLAAVLFPTCPGGSRPRPSAVLRPFDAAGLSRECCPFRFAKFVDIRSTWSVEAARTSRPRTVHQPEWASVVKSLTSTLPSRDMNDTAIATLTAQAWLRGLTSKEASPSASTSSSASSTMGTYTQGIQRVLQPVSWQKSSPPEAVCSISRGASQDGMVGRRAAAVCANRTHIEPVLGAIAARCGVMLKARAYQHWYSRHGIEDEDFDAALETMQRVQEQYREAARPEGREVGCTPALRRIRDYA